MRRRLAYVLLVASILSLTLASLLQGAALADDLQSKQQRQDQLSGQIGRDRGQIATLQGQQASTQVRLDQLNAQISAAEANLAQQNSRLDALLGQIDDTNIKLARKQAEVAETQAMLNSRTRDLYKMGGERNYINALFGASSFSDLLDRFIIMRDILHANDVLLLELQQEKRDIEALKASLSQQRDQQAALVNQMKAQAAQLNQQYAQQSALQAQLHIQQTSLEAQVAAAEKALAQVKAEIASLEAARKRAHSSGYFAWPGVQGPITQPFGCTSFAGEPPPPPGYSCSRDRPYFHTGIDIAGPYGSEVAAADGGIAYAYVSGYGYGNHIIIVHANGFTTLYGHLSGFAVSSGQSVGKGQAIGYEGSTGFSTGPHLHFEVRLNDAPQDPCRYVGC